jgi:hypothetical protein
MAYLLAQPSDWITYYNPGTLGDLCSDTGIRVQDLTNNPRALTYLSAASGEVASACLVSRLYTIEDLTEIATTAGPSQDALKRLVCQIALRLAMENRPEKFTETCEKQREVTEATLDHLRQGKRLFVVPSKPFDLADGGLPKCEGMTTAQVLLRNSLPNRTRNFYPNQGQRMPLNRQSP